MKLQEHQYIYVQSFKHDGTLHRTWAMGYVLEANEKRMIVVTNKALVTETDGRKWVTREPAIWYFYPDKWYNILCMIRKTGIHYYCNLASPAIYDGEALKYIDYDLDVKISPQGKHTLLDEEEYRRHTVQMGYSDKLQEAVKRGLDRLMVDIRLRNAPFYYREVSQFYEKYQIAMETEGLVE